MFVPAPPGFVYETVGLARVLVDATRRERLLADGLGRMTIVLDAARARGGGRGGAFDLTLGGEDLVMRVYRRGGWMRLFGRDRFVSAVRSFQEVNALVTARARGVAAVAPVAAVSLPTGLGFQRHFLFTLRERGAVDLLDALAARHRVPAARRALVDAAARALRAAFEAGIEHADLHPRNLLVVDAPEPACKLVDLDRAVLHGSALPPAVRIALLARFARYLVRHRDDGASSLSRADFARIVRGIEGSDWRRTARAAVARERRMRWFHPAAWSFARPVESGVTPARRSHGSPAPLDPKVSLLLVVTGAAEARRAVDAALAAAATTGLDSLEIIAVARDRDALSALRELSLEVAALRFAREPAASEGAAWRFALRGARGARVVALRAGAFSARFFAESLERLEQEADVVVGDRGAAGSRESRSFVQQLADRALAFVASRVYGRTARDPLSTVAARRDERFEAAVRALRAERLVIAELLARLSEAGARLREIPVDATRAR